MDNYSEGKNAYTINLKEEFPDFIKRYYINKERGEIDIIYFNGETKTVSLTEKTIAKIDLKQQEQLKAIHDLIVENNKSYQNNGLLKMEAIESMIDTLLMLGFSRVTCSYFPLMGNLMSLGFIGLVTRDMYVLLKHKYKLVRTEKDVKLASFLLHNKEEATEIIRDEITKRSRPLPTQNLVLQFPDDAPYSRNLYEQGLNLSTIDDLTKKQQKQLQKTIQRKNKTDKGR